MMSSLLVELTSRGFDGVAHMHVFIFPKAGSTVKPWSDAKCFSSGPFRGRVDGA